MSGIVNGTVARITFRATMGRKRALLFNQFAFVRQFTHSWCGILPLRPWAPGGGEGRGEVGDARALADKPTSPSHRRAMGPFPLPLKGGEGSVPQLFAESSVGGR